jgi:hypothetical protein
VKADTDVKTTATTQKTSENKVQEDNSSENTASKEDVSKPSEPQVEEQAAPTEYEKAFEEGKIAGLQEAILAIMSKNGPITDQMKNDVYNQTHIPSLINWVKSFR